MYKKTEKKNCFVIRVQPIEMTLAIYTSSFITQLSLSLTRIGHYTHSFYDSRTPSFSTWATNKAFFSRSYYTLTLLKVN